MPGERYGLHVDDDPPPGPVDASGGGSSSAPLGAGPALGRIATALVYLNDVAVGGETIFTHDPADYQRGAGNSAGQRERLAELCGPAGFADSRATRISPRCAHPHCLRVCGRHLCPPELPRVQHSDCAAVALCNVPFATMGAERAGKALQLHGVPSVLATLQSSSRTRATVPVPSAARATTPAVAGSDETPCGPILAARNSSSRNGTCCHQREMVRVFTHLARPAFACHCAHARLMMSASLICCARMGGN